MADTDAVNVLQLRESMNEAIQQSNTYTDMRLAAVNYNVQEVRKLAFAGTAGALAAAGMPQIAERGKSMFAVGYGTYEGQSAMAMGYSRALGDGSMVFRAGAHLRHPEPCRRQRRHRLEILMQVTNRRADGASSRRAHRRPAYAGRT